MKALIDVGGHLDLIVTLHDHVSRGKSGRIYVDDFARENGIPVLKVDNINEVSVTQALRDSIDWFFIIGWSQIAHADILHAARCGAIGAHPTLLPQGRGRAAIPWTILKNLSVTGVSFFKLDEGVDTGPILESEEIPVAPDETAATLYQKMADSHRRVMVLLYNHLKSGTLTLRPQVECGASIWPGRKPEDGLISSTMSVDEVERLVRATTRPYPGAFVMKSKGKLIIWEGLRGEHTGVAVHCRDGIYTATEVEWS